jgi:hypothetical protein
MPGVGVSKSENEYSSEGTPRDPGAALGGGLLNYIFGADQRLSNGQFVLGGEGAAGGGLSPDSSDYDIAMHLGVIGDGVDGAVEYLRATGSSEKDIAEYLENQKANYDFSDDDKRQINNFRDKMGQPVGAGDIPGFAAFQHILDATTGINPFADDFLDITGNLAQQGKGLFDSSVNALTELINTGSPVDVSGLVNKASAQTKESFSNIGDLFSSDSRNANTQITSELETAAAEAAKQRQLSAIGLGQNIGPAFQGFSSNMLNLGSQYEGVATPYGRELGLMNNMFGQQSTNPFSVGSDTFAQGSGSSTEASVRTP